MLARCVDYDQGLGLVFFQFGGAGEHFVLREIQGANNMAAGVILGSADVDDHGLIGIDQRRQLTRGQAATTLAHFIGGQQCSKNDESASDQIVIRGEGKQMINHQKVPGR